MTGGRTPTALGACRASLPAEVPSVLLLARVGTTWTVHCGRPRVARAAPPNKRWRLRPASSEYMRPGRRTAAGDQNPVRRQYERSPQRHARRSTDACDAPAKARENCHESGARTPHSLHADARQPVSLVSAANPVNHAENCTSAHEKSPALQGSESTPPRGFEPLAETHTDGAQGAADTALAPHEPASECGHCSENCATPDIEAACTGIPDDAELRAVVSAWPTLPEPIRVAVVALVKAAQMPRS